MENPLPKVLGAPLTASIPVVLAISLLAALTMGLFNRGNKFEVESKTIVITGGSQGMGRGVAKLLAQKGANIVIVARTTKKLQDAVEYISAAAKNPAKQRFHYISADLMDAKECSRVIAEVTVWNNGMVPDVVWCVAGGALPGFFIDLPTERIKEQMETNYFSAAYMAHATLKTWLAPSPPEKASNTAAPRHLIFTASVAGLYTIAGYSGYSPAKAALRNLSDALQQEVLIYNGSRQHTSGNGPAADVKVHTIFPGTILSPGLEIESQTKPGVTKKLEEDDPQQTEDEVAATSVRGLEKGDYLVTGTFLGWAMRSCVLSGSPRNNRFTDTLMNWATSIAWLFIQPSLDGTAFKWGKEKGHPSTYAAGS